MLADEDLYSDLPEITTADNIAKLETECSTLKTRIQELEKELSVMREIEKENKTLVRENETLKTNLSSLYLTAKAEIRRKNDSLQEYRKQLNERRLPDSIEDVPNNTEYRIPNNNEHRAPSNIELPHHKDVNIHKETKRKRRYEDRESTRSRSGERKSPEADSFRSKRYRLVEEERKRSIREDRTRNNEHRCKREETERRRHHPDLERSRDDLCARFNEDRLSRRPKEERTDLIKDDDRHRSREERIKLRRNEERRIRDRVRKEDRPKDSERAAPKECRPPVCRVSSEKLVQASRENGRRSYQDMQNSRSSYDPNRHLSQSVRPSFNVDKHLSESLRPSFNVDKHLRESLRPSFNVDKHLRESLNPEKKPAEAPVNHLENKIVRYNHHEVKKSLPNNLNGLNLYPKHAHYTPLKFMNGELSQPLFSLGTMISPLANTPDHHKETCKAKVTPVPLINEYRVLETTDKNHCESDLSLNSENEHRVLETTDKNHSESDASLNTENEHRVLETTDKNHSESDASLNTENEHRVLETTDKNHSESDASLNTENEHRVLETTDENHSESNVSLVLLNTELEALESSKGSVAETSMEVESSDVKIIVSCDIDNLQGCFKKRKRKKMRIA